MRKLLVLVLLTFILGGCGCDNFQVMGGLNQTSFAGTVSIVRLTVTGNGTQVTFVTLVTTSGSQDFTFCGNLVNQFPMQSSVQGSFTPGTQCGNIVRITIVG